MRLDGAHVLVTGASGGIGQATARTLAGRGARLTLSGRRADVLASLAAETDGRALECDAGDRDALEWLIDAAGRVDVLVANAALPATGHVTELSQSQIDTMLEVNLRAPIRLARALAPAMVQRGFGQLVFIGSLSAKAASPVSSLYNATKFGLRGFALAIREDLRDSGVGVSIVNPGFVSSAGMFHDSGISLPPGVGTRTPEHVAAAVMDAIERNRAEVSVAPWPLRLGAGLSGLLPGPSAAVQRVAGGADIARRLAAAQVDKRPAS